jgi:protein-tyrosine-phosphatase
MAEVLLRSHLHARGIDAHVHSAGTMYWDGPAAEHAVAVMLEIGVDLSTHRSRPLTPAMLDEADLVLGMTRSHVAAAGNHSPDAADRTFLVGELVRLGESVGPRRADEPVRDWVARVARVRPAGAPGRAIDEVADPLGEPFDVYRGTARRLDTELRAVAMLLAP